jgi:AcrR family transcriptional regulator
MALTERQINEQAHVRTRIIEAARLLFVERGYEAVSLRKIADSIGYTAPALYTHFKDKADLMRAICREDYAALATTFSRIGRTADPVERVVRAGMAYVRFAVEHPNHYRLMFMTPPPMGVEPEPEDLAKIGNPDLDGYAFLRAAVDDLVKAGKVREVYADADLLAQVLWAGVHGVVSLQITHKHDPWISWRALDRRARTMIETQLRGLLTPGAAKEAGL